MKKRDLFPMNEMDIEFTRYKCSCFYSCKFIENFRILKMLLKVCSISSGFSLFVEVSDKGFPVYKGLKNSTPQNVLWTIQIHFYFIPSLQNLGLNYMYLASFKIICDKGLRYYRFRIMCFVVLIMSKMRLRARYRTW